VRRGEQRVGNTAPEDSGPCATKRSVLIARQARSRRYSGHPIEAKINRGTDGSPECVTERQSEAAIRCGGAGLLGDQRKSASCQAMNTIMFSSTRRSRGARDAEGEDAKEIVKRALAAGLINDCHSIRKPWLGRSRIREHS